MSYSGPLIFLYDGLSERHQYPPWTHLGPECNHLTQLVSPSCLESQTDFSPPYLSLWTAVTPCHRQPITGSASARERCFYPITVNTATVWEKWSWQAATVLIHFNETSCRWTTLNLFSAVTTCQHTAPELTVRTFSHFCWNFKKAAEKETRHWKWGGNSFPTPVNPSHQYIKSEQTVTLSHHSFCTAKVASMWGLLNSHRKISSSLRSWKICRLSELTEKFRDHQAFYKEGGD